MCRGWFENQKVATSYNKKDWLCNQHQPGGTAIITQGEVAQKWTETTVDKKFMGRWSSQLI